MEPDINPEIRKRITAAADQLCTQAGDGSIPNVDAVRRSAKANMNDVSAVMKEWRRAHLAKAARVPLLIPDPVQQASQVGLERLWHMAQECANSHLRTAQAGWEQERAENDALCQQLSRAFDEQAQLSAEQQRQLQELGDAIRAMAEQREAAEQALAASDADKAAATARAERAEAAASSQEQRAADMKEQLALANAALAHAHADLEKTHERSEATANALRAELQAATASTADTARALAIEKVQSAKLTETLNATREQLSGLEQRAAKTEALAAEAQRRVNALEQRSTNAAALAEEAQRQVTALSDELTRARSDAHQARQALQAAQTSAAINQGERDAMAANLAQLLAAFKSGNSATPATPKGRQATTPDKPNGEAKE